MFIYITDLQETFGGSQVGTRFFLAMGKIKIYVAKML